MLLTVALKTAEYSMMSFKKPLRVAIFGASGIGQVHARIFNQLGADVCAILGSSNDSAIKTALILKNKLNIIVQPFSDLNILLKKIKPDIVSICTPPNLHYEQIITCFDHNVAVFCEKPLFWNKAINLKELEKKLTYIKNHPNRRFFVNTCNASFLDQLGLVKPKNLNSFSFIFYTQGKNKRKEIALDLLPHALSLLLNLLPNNQIKNFNEKITQNKYFCTFNYGNCLIKFDLQEEEDGPKELLFEINDRKFTRIQKGKDATYKVYFLDSYTNKQFKVEDPFSVYIKKFLNFCYSKKSIQDEFDEAAFNMRLMGEILLRNKND